MLRECVTTLPVVILVLLAPGCSLVLDFSDRAMPPGDAPYDQAECNYKEPNDSLATAAVITPADLGPAAICAGDPADHDFYRFTVPPATARVALRVMYVYRPQGDLDLRLYDKAGTPVADSRSFRDEERIECPGATPPCNALAADDYVFEVLPATSGAVNRYTIELELRPM
jgi:hypothetical protein